jgi:hypothetical protein
MTSKLIPIVCGTALALMAGAAASHHWHLGEMLSYAQATRAWTAEQPAEGTPTPAGGTRELIRMVREENAVMERQLAQRRPAAPAPSHQSNGQLDQVLSELVAINRELRTQIAETNRDLMELRFQVDTHSEQFRPLNRVEEPVEQLDAYDADSYDTSIGVLPPRDLR